MLGEKANNPFSALVTPTRVQAERIEVLGGGYIQNGAICVFSMTYKALKTATNSPSLLTGLPQAIADSALNIVDLTSGIMTAIGNSIPCAISSAGTLVVQSITTDHIYSVSGAYIMA